MTIPASQIVQINPGVIGSGGNAAVLNGLILTTNAAVPIGSVMPFATAASVAAFFGAASTEAALAAIYFQGRDNATKLPSSLYFAQYPTSAVSGYLRGGSLASMTLAQLQALSGVLTVSVDGTSKTSSAINLSGASSFSAAAATIQAAFTSLGGTVSYDSQRAAFVFTSSTTGASSSVSFASGTLAAGLNLTQATGAVISAGAVQATPATAMASIVAITRNWATFMTAFEPVITDKLAFASWTSAQNKRFAYVAWDTDATATQALNTTAFAPQVVAAAYDGVVPICGDAAYAASLGVTLASIVQNLAAFVLGATASIDFTRTEGRITYAFKSLAGLTASVADPTAAANLKANGYNFYGAYANANNNWQFFYPGSVSGKYGFLDEFVNQIWLSAQLETALVSLLTTVNSLPYNAQGYALVDAACNDPIVAAVNFGAIRPGVPLSSQQAAIVNSQAGAQIAGVLSTRGWYLQIQAATAQTRGQRQSPPITLWYMDGGSIQQITMASIVVQ
jgi:hypothetical protein